MSHSSERSVSRLSTSDEQSNLDMTSHHGNDSQSHPARDSVRADHSLLRMGGEGSDASVTDKLTTAIMLACEAHDGQTDRNGEPYILHPLRVMQAMSSETDRIVAVLHDVAEDFEAGWDRITDGDFSEDVVDAIDALTRRKGEPYSEFVLRAAENDIARRVKIADVRDNLRPGAPHLEQRYRDALVVLEGREP